MPLLSALSIPHPQRNALRLLLSLPAAITAILWVASHFWLTWYSSLPENTPVGAGGAPQHTRICLHAGILHINSDSFLQATSPRPNGTIMLGYNIDSARRYESGTQFRWSPCLPWRDSWQVQMQRGNWRFPLVIPLAILMVPPLAARLITRRTRASHCPTCNYNRTGIPITTPCPECGKLPK